jgi:hypothetical protein
LQCKECLIGNSLFRSFVVAIGFSCSLSEQGVQKASFAYFHCTLGFCVFFLGSLRLLWCKAWIACLCCGEDFFDRERVYVCEGSRVWRRM